MTEKEMAGAEFSECGLYRYKLWRIWQNDLPLAMCIGLNPSTANANKNDQTISYLIKMLNILGYGGFYMMNCWALISSDPKKLIDHRWNDLICKWNDDTITVTASKCKDVIFGNYLHNGRKMVKMLVLQIVLHLASNCKTTP